MRDRHGLAILPDVLRAGTGAAVVCTAVLASSCAGAGAHATSHPSHPGVTVSRAEQGWAAAGVASGTDGGALTFGVDLGAVIEVVVDRLAGVSERRVLRERLLGGKPKPREDGTRRDSREALDAYRAYLLMREDPREAP